MENFLTAAKLHTHAKRFMDVQRRHAAAEPRFAIPQTAARRFCCFWPITRKTARQGNLRHAPFKARHCVAARRNAERLNFRRKRSRRPAAPLCQKEAGYYHRRGLRAMRSVARRLRRGG